MDTSKGFYRNEERRDLHVRSCAHCEAVHFKAGNVLLNFTKDEFAELVYGVNEVFRNEFADHEFFHLSSSLEARDADLSSDMFSSGIY